MAHVEKRPDTKSGPRWRVTWIEDGTKQQQTFGDRSSADNFRTAVEQHGNRWPRGYVKGAGWTEDPATVLRFGDWAETAIAARPEANERTKADYRRDLRRHVVPHVGHLGVDQITSTDVGKWLVALQSSGLSAKSIRNIHGLASSVMRQAVEDQKASRNPFAGRATKLPDARTEDKVFLTPTEVEMLVGAVTEHYRPFVRFLANTGLRFGEATALRVGDVTLMGSRPSVRVDRAWKRRGGEFYLGDPKTKRGRRTLALSSALIDLLVPVVAAKHGGEFVFTTREGQPIRHNNFYSRVWMPAVEAVNTCAIHGAEGCVCIGVLGKRPTPHSMRHSHASHLIARGVPLKAIQQRLGHSSIVTTADTYGHLADNMDDMINAAVDSALPKPSDPSPTMSP